MPAMTVRPFGRGVLALLNKEADLNSDTLKMTLHTSTYTPDYDVHDYVNDLSNELSTAGGYTAGGLTLTSPTITQTVANSWTQQWTLSTAYTLNQIVRPTSGNGFIYQAVVAGTSSGTQPTWPTTIGLTVTDGGVTWACVGRGAVIFDFADPSWATFSAGPFRTAVVADYTPGTSATQPLICAFAFASDQTGGGGTFNIVVDVNGAVVLPYS